MPKAEQAASAASTDSHDLLNRDISWLEFNCRVLHGAMDRRTPLLERVALIATFSQNLDEFFMVRVAGLKQKLAAGLSQRSPDGLTQRQQLTAIHRHLRPMLEQQQQHWQMVLLPQLSSAGIHLQDYAELSAPQQDWLAHAVETNILPALTPLAIEPGQPHPASSNLSLWLLVVLRQPPSRSRKLAWVQVPPQLSPLVPLPPEQWTHPHPQATWQGLSLVGAIAHHSDRLFPGFDVHQVYPFRITRSAALGVQGLDLQSDDDDGDLVNVVEQGLHRQQFGGAVVRLEVAATMPRSLRRSLSHELDIGSTDIYELNTPLPLGDLLALAQGSHAPLHQPQHTYPAWMPTPHPQLRRSAAQTSTSATPSLFKLIRQHDILLHHPYHSFAGSVQRFLEQAAQDPDVLAIKMTLYRTSGDSPIVAALLAAAENGKQVAVLIEIQARFDEANNIQWARRLEEVGVHVVYGMVGLKTHAKLILVVRQEGQRLRRYIHAGTGNYNPTTAQHYADLGLLSCRDDLGADMTDLFNYLTGYSRQQLFRKLLVAPMNLRDRLLRLIRREAEHSRAGHHARIVAQMNALCDPVLIAALYEASQAGVSIDLVVRDACCLRPGIKGLSDRIRVISLMGRFLEHSRVIYLHNGGQEEVYIGSADWITRNLDHRVETLIPIEDPALIQDIQETLGLLLVDNRHAWDLHPDGSYRQRRPRGRVSERNAQAFLMQRVQSSGSTVD
ncbi:MAG: polyphosphate kinase 1 [Kaiparowitsia implicata GSE-PSE-MK54-09C]|jgi:polyphosphate kinase|nr:polyphosphate kinase 1 [Kaiparowitsia implicata GSE-PSE-MK54-09C]